MSQKRRGSKTYAWSSSDIEGYRWIDKDPICGVIQEALREACGRGLKLTDIAASAQVSWTTINNIDRGKTRRPANVTVDRILLACGYSRSIMLSMADAAGVAIKAEDLHSAMEKIASGNLSQKEIISLARKALGRQ